MNKSELFLKCSFCGGILLTLMIPAIIRGCPLLFMAPPLVYLFYRRTFDKCLWVSVGCGLLMDLLSGYSHFGVFALSFALTCWVIFPQKQYFFEDSLVMFPIMTLLFSLAHTVILGVVISSLEEIRVITWSWFFIDGLGYAIVESFYAFIVFSIPYHFFVKQSVAEA